MAYLNVRENRIEAKITYVGAELSGKATNLRHLQDRTDAPIQTLDDMSFGIDLSLKREDLGRDLPPTATVNDWLNHGRENPLKGGDMVVVDGVWAQIRKVRRRRITEALLDPLGNPFEKRPAESGNGAIAAAGEAPSPAKETSAS